MEHKSFYDMCINIAKIFNEGRHEEASLLLQQLAHELENRKKAKEHNYDIIAPTKIPFTAESTAGSTDY